MILRTSAVILVAALVAGPAGAAEIGYLAPPGVPASEFPAPQRPVAPIVSPTRSGEQRRDFLKEGGEIARILEIKPGMTVGDIGAGSGYHTIRLSPRVGPTGSVIAQHVTRDYLVEVAKHVAQLKLTNVVFALGEPHDPRLPAAARRSNSCAASSQPAAIARSPRISSQAIADIWRCFHRRRKPAGNPLAILSLARLTDRQRAAFAARAQDGRTSPKWTRRP